MIDIVLFVCLFVKLNICVVLDLLTARQRYEKLYTGAILKMLFEYKVYFVGWLFV